MVYMSFVQNSWVDFNKAAFCGFVSLASFSYLNRIAAITPLKELMALNSNFLLATQSVVPIFLAQQVHKIFERSLPEPLSLDIAAQRVRQFRILALDFLVVSMASVTIRMATSAPLLGGLALNLTGLTAYLVFRKIFGQIQADMWQVESRPAQSVSTRASPSVAREEPQPRVDSRPAPNPPVSQKPAMPHKERASSTKIKNITIQNFVDVSGDRPVMLGKVEIRDTSTASDTTPPSPSVAREEPQTRVDRRPAPIPPVSQQPAIPQVSRSSISALSEEHPYARQVKALFPGTQIKNISIGKVFVDGVEVDGLEVGGTSTTRPVITKVIDISSNCSKIKVEKNCKLKIKLNREQVLPKLTVKGHTEVSEDAYYELESTQLILKAPEKELDYELSLSNLESLEVIEGKVEICDFQGDTFTCKIQGKGSVNISGEVNTQNVEINAAFGKYDAQNLTSKTAIVVLKGFAKAKIKATDDFNYKGEGFAKCSLYSHPVRSQIVGKIKRLS